MSDLDAAVETQRTLREFHVRSVAALIKRLAPSLTVHIALMDEPTIDEYGTTTFAEWGGWLLQVCPMAFNDRLVLTPKSNLGVYDFGWCYQRGGHAAYLAALSWDPETEGEPRGFIKSIGYRPRRPGERADTDWS